MTFLSSEKRADVYFFRKIMMKSDEKVKNMLLKLDSLFILK